MPSKPAVKFKKVTAENAVIQKMQKIVTAKSAVKSKKWRQKMPSYIKSDGKICRHFTLSGVSGAFPLTRGILAVTSQMRIWQETPSIRRKPKRISRAIPRASRYKEIIQFILQSSHPTNKNNPADRQAHPTAFIQIKQAHPHQRM